MGVNKVIFDLSKEEINNFFHSIGEPDYRTSQLWEGLYCHLYPSWNNFTIFSKRLRGIITENFSFSTIRPLTHSFSTDKKTHKVLFELPDKNRIETVLMQYKKSNTLCISSQSGCAIGCVFCATGKMGFNRNLTSGEIIEQVIFFARELQKKGKQLTNIVIMGMGEPFYNYNATMNAISRLNNPDGFNFGSRRFTLSTIGIIPKLEEFIHENKQINLAISLHAPNNDLRNKLVPINKKYPIEELIATCKKYVKISHRRISFEYVLINEVNDSKKYAIELSSLIKDLLCHVNLIPLNPNPHFKGKPPELKVIQDFKKILESHGITTTIRRNMGIDIQAGCGQLAGSHKKL